VGMNALIFAAVPATIMLFRLAMHAQDGVASMLQARVSRWGEPKTPASLLRTWMYQRTKYGYYLDTAQAVLSAVSCLLFIVVSYAMIEPSWLTDVEDIFTIWFMADYALRLFIAQDSLVFFFSLVSFLDFFTVVPAIVMWIMLLLDNFTANVGVVVQIIRVMRVFRIFRVTRVIRVMSVSASYAFQRQVFVLIMTILSLIFAAAGIYQVRACGGRRGEGSPPELVTLRSPAAIPFLLPALAPSPSQVVESRTDYEYPFHKAVYYMAITVIGRPGIPISTAATAVFSTCLALTAATVIPTFVAELIRLWYDNTGLDRYKVDPEKPHVILCGDTNASRIRVLAAQVSCTTRRYHRHSLAYWPEAA
jgi:hypothetical protein